MFCMLNPKLLHVFSLKTLNKKVFNEKISAWLFVLKVAKVLRKKEVKIAQKNESFLGVSQQTKT